ncbi:MAG TPA: response regulator [Vicinamibacteria bacterium]
MPTVLVVDDDEAVRTLLSRFFGKKGYAVRAAESAEEALGVLEKERIHVVLLDIVLGNQRPRRSEENSNHVAGSSGRHDKRTG